MGFEADPEQVQLGRELAGHFRRLRCRAGELMVQLNVICERAPGEAELRSVAERLSTVRARADLLTACVNLEVSLQQAQKWSGRVLAAVAQGVGAASETLHS